jgi:hypothetical protein
MNKIELFFYNLVKKNPRFKRHIRNAYQRAFDFLPVKRTDSKYRIMAREGFFFGFHDKCPFSPDNRLLLAHRFNIPLRMPKADDTVGVGYFSGENYDRFNFLGKTQAWNWHQGAQLQWLGNSNNVIFNDFDGEKHFAKIVDLKGKILQKLSLPVAALSPNGKKALSYDFARLRGSPHGYGYANGIDPEEKDLIPLRHGLSIVDVPSGYSKVLFTVAQIARIVPEDSMTGTFHYFTHCQFSPSSQRFVFFHRWMKNNNQQWTRMISCNLEGKELFIFPSDGMVSHVGWRDEENVLAYARTKRYGDGYYLFRDRTGEFSLVGRESFSSDGHPSFSRDKRWFVTDTYPDRLRQRYLILYDMEKRKRYDIAKLHSPRQYAGRRFEDLYMCDLHPRWDREGKRVCFDSAHTGKRALCTIFLDGLDTIKTVD